MDENGTPQPPGQAPAPSPQQPPPPVPPAQPAYQPPAPEAGAPPAKKPTALIIIIVVVVLVLCGLFACGIGVFYLLASGQDAEEVIVEAEVHYDDASVAVEEIDGYYEPFLEIESDDVAQYDAPSSEVAALIDGARTDLADADELIGSLGDSRFKTEYSDAITLLNQSVDAYDSLYTDLPSALAVYTGLEEMMASLQDADAQLENSVAMTNAGDYEAAKTEAAAALAAYEAGVAYFEGLAAEYPDEQFDLQADIDRLYADAATAAMKAAEAGIDADNAAYQTQVAAYDEAEANLGAAPTPYWADDWSLLLADRDALYDEAWAYAEASWEAWDRAIEAYEAGDY